ncbi:dUTP diphosphatase [Candidatus Woesearchaeota archaeon]|nr:dUTP diphosphatase [Candidatus Woesearchaeota archaeon]
MVQVRIHRLDKTMDVPTYARKGDAAFDLRSAEKKVVAAGHKEIVKTALRIAVPEGYCGLIWDRSGLAAKNSMHCLAGVLDSGYRGEIGIVLQNLGKEEFVVEKNMRIAQMLIQPVAAAELIDVDDLEETERGAGGFGSTGRM